MPLIPENPKHAAQIAAGTVGRNKGHEFERTLANDLNSIDWRRTEVGAPPSGHIVTGHPARELMRYVVHHLGAKKITRVRAWWLGGLATSGEGDELLSETGEKIGKSKSDVVIDIGWPEGSSRVGISVKTCSKTTPTNDQLYFTTAVAFCNLLRRNHIPVSPGAEIALRMFCGDTEFRPKDTNAPKTRLSDPDRWFWEELPAPGRAELENLITLHQRSITTLLLQKAYSSDPILPDFVLHQTVAYGDIRNCEMAIFSMPELIALSCQYRGFWTKPYKVQKGRYKGDPNIHHAPRFGYIQFQRAGQKQHPTQLQFNLEAGYFYKLPRTTTSGVENSFAR